MRNAGLENWKQDAIGVRVTEPDAPADEKLWQIQGPYASVLGIKTINDAVSAYSELLITRVGSRIVRVEVDGVEVYAAP